MSLYVVDSNFFIEAHRKTYPLDVATGFWNKVRELAHSGQVASIDKVKAELYQNEDAITEWCKSNLPDDFFRNSSEAIDQYTLVVSWPNSVHPPYLPKAISVFLDADEADAHLIAYTLADPDIRVVVTQEQSEPQRRNSIKIPDVCVALGVRYMNTIEMFRHLEETF